MKEITLADIETVIKTVASTALKNEQYFCELDSFAGDADFGVSLPKETEIRVWDSTAETRFIVVPMRPAGTEGWSAQRLADLVTRDSMVGTGLPLNPGEAK